MTKLKILKTSISLPEILMRFGENRCAYAGFNSFSSYIAHLVREDKNYQEEIEIRRTRMAPIDKTPQES